MWASSNAHRLTRFTRGTCHGRHCASLWRTQYHTWAPRPSNPYLGTTPLFSSLPEVPFFSLSSVLITILALCPLVFPPLCILNNYSSPFCQVSDVYPEPFEYSITFFSYSSSMQGQKYVFFYGFCRTWTKRYLITSQTRVKRVSRIHHRTMVRLTLVCEVIRYRLVQVRQKPKKDFSGWRPAIALLYLFLFHSLLCLTSFLSQYKNKNTLLQIFLISTCEKSYASLKPTG